MLDVSRFITIWRYCEPLGDFNASHFLSTPCNIRINSLALGTTHSCFRVKMDILGKPMSIVVKFFSVDDNTQLKRIEALQSQSLGDLFPHFIAFNRQENCALYHFVDGEVCSVIDSDVIAVLSASLTSLARLPKKPVNLPTVNLIEVIESLATELSSYVSFNFAAIERSVERINDTSSLNRLCHGDLNLSNIVQVNGSESLSIIDWDFACLAPFEYELAMTSSINCLSFEQTDRVIEQVLNKLEHKMKINPRIVTRYLNLCNLINGLWYFRLYLTANDNAMLSMAKRFFAATPSSYELSINSEIEIKRV